MLNLTIKHCYDALIIAAVFVVDVIDVVNANVVIVAATLVYYEYY